MRAKRYHERCLARAKFNRDNPKRYGSHPYVSVRRSPLEALVGEHMVEMWRQQWEEGAARLRGEEVEPCLQSAYIAFDGIKIGEVTDVQVKRSLPEQGPMGSCVFPSWSAEWGPLEGVITEEGIHIFKEMIKAVKGEDDASDSEHNRSTEES